MNNANVVQMGFDAMIMAAKLAAPALLTAMLVGVFIGLLQAATQLQEPTVAFVPKLAAVGLAILLTGNWMLSQLVDYTHQLWSSVPNLLS